MTARAAGAGARRVAQNGELERLLDGARLQELADRMFRSRLATDVVDAFFDGPLFGRFVDELLAGEALWMLVDRVAASPAVTAAVSQQGLSFAEVLTDQLRSRSRWADDLVDQVVARLLRRGAADPPAPG
jgi:hypothetical protein